MASNVHLSGLAQDLYVRFEQGNPVRIGLIGVGEMGVDIITNVAQMKGIEVAAACDLNIETIQKSLDIAHGSRSRGQIATSVNGVTAAIEAQKMAITQDADLVINNPLIDVIIDATGVASVGGDIALKAIKQGRHLVAMNVETWVTAGAYIKHEADRAGVIYTLGSGDEPSACMELIEFVSAMGCQVVAAGKGKNNPLNFGAVPDEYFSEATRRNMNVRMLVEFVDGSKTMIEMAALANATGLVPDVPGMHGVSAKLKDLANVFVHKEFGGVLNREGVVDYSVGEDVAPGVFVVIKTEHPRIIERMEDLKVGKGPYFTFYRPYHLTSLEVALSCARTVLYKRADMTPLKNPVAEVCALAKKDLKPGESLDGIGGYCYHAWIKKKCIAESEDAIPCGLLQDGRIIQPINKGELLTYRNIEVPQDKTIVKIRHLQDKMLTRNMPTSYSLDLA